MVNPNELMQGNILWVAETNELVKVVMINDVNIDVEPLSGGDRMLFRLDQLNPVKPTYSILDILGFTKEEGKSFWRIDPQNGNGWFRICLYDGVNLIDYDDQFIFLNLCIESVHHLQNVYFLTQNRHLVWDRSRVGVVQTDKSFTKND